MHQREEEYHNTLYTCSTRQISGILLNFLINVNWKLTVLGSWRPNIIWKLLWNDSGMILDLLEIDSEPCFDQEGVFWTFLLTWTQNLRTNEHMISESQHLVMNPAQWSSSECAPGHDSIKDASVIKSYCPKSGVADSENLEPWLEAILEGGPCHSRVTYFAPEYFFS